MKSKFHKKRMMQQTELANVPNFLKLLEVKAQQLSRQHRRIANFLLHNHLEAAFLNASELAERAGVSSATVVRFATAMGFSGFPALQKELQQIAQGSIGKHEFLAVEASDKDDTLSATIRQSMKALKTFSEELDNEYFLKAANTLYRARKIVTVGHKASFGVAVHASYVLGKVHKDVRYIQGTDEFDAFSAINDLSEEDAALIFTVIHYPRSTLKLIRHLARKGVKIIVVSDYRTFDEISLAEVSLLTPLLFQGFLDIMSPMLALTDALAYEIYKLDEPVARKRLKEFNEFNEQDGAFLQICRFAE